MSEARGWIGKPIDLRRSGVWLLKDGRTSRIAIYVKDAVDPFRQRSDNTFYWLDDIEAVDDNDILMGLIVGEDVLSGGVDITDEFLADKRQIELLALRAPAWLDLILQDWPQARVSKEVIKIWSQSGEKNVRLLVAKYISRIDVAEHEEVKPVRPRGF